MTYRLFNPRFLLAAFVFFYSATLLPAAEPEPSFKVISRDGSVEIRDYPASLTAEITIPGKRDVAIQAALTLLTDYFRGNNLDNKKLSSAKPLLHAEAGPITAALPKQTSPRSEFDEQWTVALQVLGQKDAAALPKPGDRRIDLVDTPPRRLAVLSFSGLWSDDNLELHRNELGQWLKAKGLKPLGEPIFAFYDEFWMPPFWRHNEVRWQIAPE
jgi:SOUL heme-binding protein